MAAIKKKRSLKTTQTQYIVYLERLTTDEVLRTNKFNPNNANAVENTWAKLTAELNSCGGPQRSVKQWKKVLSDWRCTVRKKARILKNYALQTGGGPPPERPLTDIENKLIDLLGHVVIDGIDGVSEFGLPLSPNTEIGNDGTENILTNIENNIQKPSQGEKNKKAIPVLKHKQPRKKNTTLLGSIKQHLNKYVEKDYSPVLQEINANLTQLVNIEKKKLEVQVLKLQIEHPDIDVAMSLAEDENATDL